MVNKKAFTLVELIVVIIILLILATIGFISLQGFSADSRNSKRISELSELRNGLSIYQARNSVLPIPSEERVIIGSGTTEILIQGYAGKSVLTDIKLVGEIKDPITDNYYTYSINGRGNRFQLFSSIEGESNNGNGYITVGNGIGILLNSTTNLPIQETQTGTIDLSNNSDNYIAIFGDGGDGVDEFILSGSDLYDEILSRSDGNNLSSGGGNGGGSLLTCEEIITDDQVDELNSLWMNYEMDIRGDKNWDIYYDVVNDGIFTKEQWCNDIEMIELYTANTINSNLINIYNNINNQPNIYYYNADLNSHYTNLIQINKLFLVQNGWQGGTYNSLIWEMQNLHGLELNSLGIINIPINISNLINLERLSLRLNDISIIPPEIGNLTNLISVDISRNNITNIPSEIGNLINLSMLDLQQNNITNIPSEIGNLTKLEGLYLNSNNISIIPPEIGNLNLLSWFWISNNNLQLLPSELSNLNNLTNLHLGSNSSLGNLSFYFLTSTPNRTQGGMTIGGNGSRVVVTGSF